MERVIMSPRLVLTMMPMIADRKEMEPVCNTHEKRKEMLGKYKC